MSVHAETVCTVIGTGVGVATVVIGSVRKLAKSLGRIGDMLEDFRGRPADPARGLMTPKPGVMAQLADLKNKTCDLDRGQLHIIDEINQIKRKIPSGGSR